MTIPRLPAAIIIGIAASLIFTPIGGIAIGIASYYVNKNGISSK